MKRMRIMLNHCIATGPLILFISLVIGCEKEPLIIIEDSDLVADVDGNTYRTVKIGEQIWMTENLNVSHFRNGDLIPEAETAEEWIQAGTESEPAWCYYDNDPENGEKYGKLYNWYAVNDPRGLAPENWTIPDNKDWEQLIDYLGGNRKAGMVMKSVTGWNSNGNGDNYSKFAALPGGGRAYFGDFLDLGNAEVWWSSSEESALSAYGINLNGSNGNVLQGSFNKITGLSIRALKCTSCSDDTTARLTLSEKLQAALDLSMESSNGKGLSAAVIMPDGVTWRGVGGVSHDNVKIKTDMRFSAGSIEKMFAATTILQLAEEGKITLEDPLYKWLPAFPYIDSMITIRQLLNHTGGIYHYVDNRDFWDAWFQEPSKFWTLEGIVLTFNREPYFPRGTGWHYSQTGYNLLRMIIRKITGSEISIVNRDRFFVPSGLTNTFTSMGETLPGNIAHGWYDTDKDLEYEDFFSMQRTPFASGIGGEVWSTPEDLAKWARALFHDKTVVSQTSLDQMLTFYSPCTGEELFGDGYGLGVCKFNSQLLYGLEAYGHGGHGPGYAAGCIYLPDYEVCIGIMDNTDGGECIGTSVTKLIKVIISHLEEKRNKK
jgi:uncharacterized protein (TIGR02145 family)